MRPLHVILSARREALGLTIKEVHARLQTRGVDVSPATVGHWFTGERRPRKMEHLKSLCESLGITVAEATGEKPHEAVTAMEQVMLSGFRELPPGQQEAMLALLTSMRGKAS